jgi:hypothetical protein
MANKKTKVDKQPAKKSIGRRPRFVVNVQKQTNEVEQISKFLKAAKELDLSKPDAAEQFEIVCLSTLGYTSRVVRELLLNLVKSTF